MAYNPYYPGFYQTYPQTYPQTNANQIQMPVQQNQPQSGIIWVQGEAGAKSYMIAPNTTVQLWDSESQTIYLKSADASGMPSMRILDYTIRDNNSSQPHNNITLDYATQDDLKILERKLNDRLDEIIRGNIDGKSTL